MDSLLYLSTDRTTDATQIPKTIPITCRSIGTLRCSVGRRWPIPGIGEERNTRRIQKCIHRSTDQRTCNKRGQETISGSRIHETSGQIKIRKPMERPRKWLHSRTRQLSTRFDLLLNYIPPVTTGGSRHCEQHNEQDSISGLTFLQNANPTQEQTALCTLTSSVTAAISKATTLAIAHKPTQKQSNYATDQQKHHWQ